MSPQRCLSVCVCSCKCPAEAENGGNPQRCVSVQLIGVEIKERVGSGISCLGEIGTIDTRKFVCLLYEVLGERGREGVPVSRPVCALAPPGRAPPPSPP